MQWRLHRVFLHNLAYRVQLLPACDTLAGGQRLSATNEEFSFMHSRSIAGCRSASVWNSSTGVIGLGQYVSACRENVNPTYPSQTQMLAGVQGYKPQDCY